MNSLDTRCEEVLKSLQDALPKQRTIIDNLYNYAVEKGDAKLISGIEDLKKATEEVNELVALKVALNGTALEIALEDAKKAKAE